MAFELVKHTEDIDSFERLLDSTKKKQLCLCEQENDEQAQILNKWSVNFPAENQERPNSIKFKSMLNFAYLC